MKVSLFTERRSHFLFHDYDGKTYLEKWDSASLLPVKLFFGLNAYLIRKHLAVIRNKCSRAILIFSKKKKEITKQMWHQMKKTIGFWMYSTVHTLSGHFLPFDFANPLTWVLIITLYFQNLSQNCNFLTETKILSLARGLKIFQSPLSSYCLPTIELPNHRRKKKPTRICIFLLT